MPAKKYFTDAERKAARRERQAKYYAKPEIKAKRTALDKLNYEKLKSDPTAYAENQRRLKEERALRLMTPEGQKKERKHVWKQQNIVFENEAEFEKWVALALDPNTKCPVTGMTNAEHLAKYGCRLALDHDHQTGSPRRFLARHVNIALGGIEGLTPEQITNLLRLYEEDRRTRDDIA